MALARCNFAVQDEAGNIVDGASIEVRLETTNALVSVYADRDAATPLGNPFIASDGADPGFHVVDGEYKVTATKDGFTRTWRYVAVVSPGGEVGGDAVIVTAAGAYQIGNGETDVTIHRTVAETADLFLPAVVDAIGDVTIVDGGGTFDTNPQTLKPKAATTDTIVGLSSVPLSAKYASITLRPYARSGADVWLIL